MKRGSLSCLFYTGSLEIRHSSYPQAVYNLAGESVADEDTRCRCGVCDLLPPEWLSLEGAGAFQRSKAGMGPSPALKAARMWKGRGKAAEGKEQGGTHQMPAGDLARSVCSVQAHHTGKWGGERGG